MSNSRIWLPSPLSVGHQWLVGQTKNKAALENGSTHPTVSRCCNWKTVNSIEKRHLESSSSSLFCQQQLSGIAWKLSTACTFISFYFPSTLFLNHLIFSPSIGSSTPCTIPRQKSEQEAWFLFPAKAAFDQLGGMQKWPGVTCPLTFSSSANDKQASLHCLPDSRMSAKIMTHSVFPLLQGIFCLGKIGICAFTLEGNVW